MNRDKARARVQCAQLELDAAEKQLAACWRPWRERLHRQRLPLLIGGGLLGGLALALVPPRIWANVGASLFGNSARVARSALGPSVVGALLAAIQRSVRFDRVVAPDRPVAPSAECERDAAVS